MDSETPLPVGVVDSQTYAQPGGDATDGTMPLPLDVARLDSAVARSSGDATSGTMPLPLPLEVAGLASAGARSENDPSDGTMPLPLDEASIERSEV